MIFRRTQNQVKRLRDLISEVQENHTRIQRLWKKVDDAQLIWPVGIAAAPPIDEMESSSSSSSTSSSSSETSSSSLLVHCPGCDIPETLQVTISGTDIDGNPWWANGTYEMHYSSVLGGWISECEATPVYYISLGYMCDSDGGILSGPAFWGSTCAEPQVAEIFAGAGPDHPDTFTCSPFYWYRHITGFGMTSLTFEITE